jgi:APA family basic amino acid/polyamine antiporter
MLVVFMVMGATMTNSLFSADAWNNVTFTAGEVKDPKRTLARSMALGAALVIVLYVLANVAYLAALPIDGKPDGSTPFDRGIAHAKEDRVATAVLEGVSPYWGSKLMAAAIMISTFGCVNGMILMGARLYYAMARDGLFFQSVGRLSSRGVPAWGLILQGAWSILLVFSGTYNRLLDFVMEAAMFFYVLTVIGLFVLRRRYPNVDRPYRAFGYPIVPGLYVVLCALITVDWLIVKPEYTLPCLAIVFTGIPVYGLWRLANLHRAIA